MSTGGIFTIITNDGKQDRMLMATALLHDRLDKIWNMKRMQNPAAKPDSTDVLPSLIDIEKTHILFTNAHFKPFAAIGFEYNKVQANTGTASLGSNLQYSIPQFGDFFHDIAFHCVLEQPVLTVNGGVTAQDAPAMRWCAWPGERLLKKVQQEVNGNPLDEYTFHATVAHREYRVSPNKMTAWKRCVGQEEAETGFLRQRDWANSGAAADAHRVSANVHVGNQTPSGQKAGTLEMFVPLLFWYNKDVRLAVPSVAIPYGQRFINIELASANEMVGLVPRGANLGNWAAPGGSLSVPLVKTAELYISNIFVNPEVHKIYIKRVGFSLIRVHRQQVTSLTEDKETLLQQLKWPIEYMYISAKVRDYYAGSTDALKAQHLDRWYRNSVSTAQTYNTSGQAVLRLSALVANPAVQTLGYTLAGALNGDATAAQNLVEGDQILVNNKVFTLTAAVAAGAVLAGATFEPVPGILVAATNGIAASSGKVSYNPLEVQTERWTPIIDTLKVSAHGIDIYKPMPAKFFNAYTSYHYGGFNINAPEDVGSLFVPFCLYPGTYQPSGHINVSRAREFYVHATSDYLKNNGNVAVNLVVIASAINFLLISDGSAVLRYST